MRKTAASAAILLLLIIFPAMVSAEIHFKFSASKQIVAASKEPTNFDIAWDGVNFGVVYDDYVYNGPSCNVYLLLVNQNGNVVNGPVKISSEKNAFHPKIIWNGKEYAILYGGGVKSGTSYKFNYYLARYNAALNELSKKKLTGTANYKSHAMQSQLLWTDNGYAIFYVADPEEPKEWADTKPLYCRTDKSGVPGPILKEYNGEFRYTDAAWDGKRYIVVGVDVMQGWTPQGVAQLLTISENGEILNETTVSGFGAMTSAYGISITPLKKKNNYLIALGGSILADGAAPTAYWASDLYTTAVKIKSKAIKGFAPKIATKASAGQWQHPELVCCGSKNYAVCYYTDPSCNIRVAEIKTNGSKVDTTHQLDCW